MKMLKEYVLIFFFLSCICVLFIFSYLHHQACMAQIVWYNENMFTFMEENMFFFI